MTETQLTALAMTVELGVPAILVALLFVAPKLRPLCYSILGAVTPFLFAYFSTWVATNSNGFPNAAIALSAMWSMSLFAYCVALLVGVVLGFMKKPLHSAMRYSAAAAAAICVVTVVLLIEGAIGS